MSVRPDAAPMPPTSVQRKPLAEETGRAVAEDLQAALVDLLDLALQSKQAHWNLIGRNFRSFHLELDEIEAEVRTASDDVAERAVALGYSVDGRPETIASQTVMDRFPEGEVHVDDALQLIADRLAGVTNRMRERIDRLDEPDPVSQDLLIGIVATL